MKTQAVWTAALAIVLCTSGVLAGCRQTVQSLPEPSLAPYPTSPRQIVVTAIRLRSGLNWSHSGKSLAFMTDNLEVVQNGNWNDPSSVAQMPHGDTLPGFVNGASPVLWAPDDQSFLVNIYAFDVTPLSSEAGTPIRTYRVDPISGALDHTPIGSHQVLEIDPQMGMLVRHDDGTLWLDPPAESGSMISSDFFQATLWPARHEVLLSRGDSLFRYDSRTGQEQFVAGFDGLRSFSPSPDKEHIVVSVASTDGAECKDSVVIIDVDGNQVADPLDAVSDWQCPRFFEVDWSPVGDVIALAVGGDPSESNYSIRRLVLLFNPIG